ncbi:hypothetical protein Mterra_00371 [Calidithermus terrae]|uniref:Uncharacterized protein n=1 Tax=Calidithermus terrae TaxID=1408545 RepID=A0A399F3W6_9DEIN|nr:hypothetical protein Mterra_00371 [Calidithermus terrae]
MLTYDKTTGKNELRTGEGRTEVVETTQIVQWGVFEDRGRWPFTTHQEQSWRAERGGSESCFP